MQSLEDTTSLTRRVAVLKRGRGVTDQAAAAAAKIGQAGGSPRAQIDAARQASGRPVLYLPHQGARETARRARRRARGQAAG